MRFYNPTQNFHQGGSDPIDRLAKLQALDTAQNQNDALQQHGALQLAQGLYGIQHENAMLPEQLRALQASTAAKEFENAQAPQNAETERALKTAQTANFQSNADAVRKYDQPTLHDVMSLWPYLPDTDRYGMLGKVPGLGDVAAAGQKRISDADAARAKDRATEDMRNGAVSPLKAGIPEQYQSDPTIQNLLRDDARARNFYQPGGQLDLQLQQDKLNRQVHPFVQGLKDLWNLAS